VTSVILMILQMI